MVLCQTFLKNMIVLTASSANGAQKIGAENAEEQTETRMMPNQKRRVMVNITQSAIVIVGASGDLASRKLIPALDALYKQGHICDSCLVVGTGRSAFTDQSFRERFDVSPEFKSHLFYHQYITGLRTYLLSKGNFSRIIFFLSQPPAAYGLTAMELKAEGFGAESSIIIEKPFGYDYKSARELNRELGVCFSESQIFRIDHYLAKEAVQNILTFRFANVAFRPSWNSHYIESIQINALESIGIVERGAYFDRAGIIRDMVQNHLLQLLCLLTMDAPPSLAAEDIRQQKINILKTIKIEEFHRFQYSGYQQEHGVNPGSTTETYAELKLSINNLRWSGTPVYIRCGKAMHRRGTEIGITFRSLPHVLFNKQGNLNPNRIIFKIQPSEGIILDLLSKAPGTEQLADTHMNFCHRDSFEHMIPEAYQRLLYDALRGDHTLFVSAAETEEAWQLFNDILDQGEVIPYTRGQMPRSKMDVSWVDFDKYVHFCS